MGHLRGMSVHVTPAPGEMSKGSCLDTNVFTDIAFETGCGLLQLEERRVFVTSISGAVYQVSAPCVHPFFGWLATVIFALCERSQRRALAEVSLESVYLVSWPSRCQCFELSMLHLLRSSPIRSTRWWFSPEATKHVS